MPSPSATLRDALAGPLADLGVDVESVDVAKAGRRHVVRIVVDRDGGIDLDLVAAVSQRASELLDAPDLARVLPGPFVLEVTSPGVDRPLTESRHWRRAVTRLVDVDLADGSRIEGRISEVPTDDTVVIATADGDFTVSLADVQRAIVQVEFNRPDATEPDATEPDATEPDEREGE